MSFLALSSSNIQIDIVHDTRQLVDALNAQYPLRRIEMEIFPTDFCQQMIEETSQSFGRPKVPTTMPRSIFDSLFEAAARCINGNISSSTIKFGGLSLSHFQLDRAYPFSLFQDGKVVVPHDSVCLALHQLHAYAIS